MASMAGSHRSMRASSTFVMGTVVSAARAALVHAAGTAELNHQFRMCYPSRCGAESIKDGPPRVNRYCAGRRRATLARMKFIVLAAWLLSAAVIGSAATDAAAPSTPAPSDY